MSSAHVDFLSATFSHIIQSGDLGGFAAALPNDFVLELIVFDGPNIFLTRDQFKNHFSAIPGFKLGQVCLRNKVWGI